MSHQFDFRLHADRSTLVGTQYFEFAPGPYSRRPWVEGARFIDEYTFSLIEGVFEERVPDYSHFAVVEISRPAWEPILGDLDSLRTVLAGSAQGERVFLPRGKTLLLSDWFDESDSSNRKSLAALLDSLETWLQQVLTDHNVVTLVGI